MELHVTPFDNTPYATYHAGQGTDSVLIQPLGLLEQSCKHGTVFHLCITKYSHSYSLRLAQTFKISPIFLLCSTSRGSKVSIGRACQVYDFTQVLVSQVNSLLWKSSSSICNKNTNSNWLLKCVAQGRCARRSITQNIFDIRIWCERCKNNW